MHSSEDDEDEVEESGGVGVVVRVGTAGVDWEGGTQVWVGRADEDLQSSEVEDEDDAELVGAAEVVGAATVDVGVGVSDSQSSLVVVEAADEVGAVD